MGAEAFTESNIRLLFSDPLKPEEIQFVADGRTTKVAFNKPIIRHVENLLRAVERNKKDQAVY